MKHSDTIAHLAAALVKASSELKPVVKDRVNPHFKNTYATLDAITEAVRPVLSKHGLTVLQGATVPETSAGVLTGFVLETMVLHASGEWLTNGVFMPIDKPSAQGAGSAITYGRRYGLAALLGLTSDEDDDGETATNHAPATRAASPYTAAPAPAPKAPAPAKRAAPTDPSAKLTGALGFVMPFGKTKGTQLGLIPPGDLESAIKWVQDRAPDKFGDFVHAAEAVLAGISVPTSADSFEGLPPDADDADDDLPFS